jgi:hypothetical protein
MRVSSEGFLDVACGSTRLRNKREDTFKEHFTFSPKVVSHAWNEMTRKGLLPKGAAPYHLLWMLYFVKNYTNNATGGTASQSCKETFRKWCRLFLGSLRRSSTRYSNRISVLPIIVEIQIFASLLRAFYHSFTLDTLE